MVHYYRIYMLIVISYGMGYNLYMKYGFTLVYVGCGCMLGAGKTPLNQALISTYNITTTGPRRTVTSQSSSSPKAASSPSFTTLASSAHSGPRAPFLASTTSKSSGTRRQPMAQRSAALRLSLVPGGCRE